MCMNKKVVFIYTRMKRICVVGFIGVVNCGGFEKGDITGVGGGGVFIFRFVFFCLMFCIVSKYCFLVKRF